MLGIAENRRRRCWLLTMEGKKWWFSWVSSKLVKIEYYEYFTSLQKTASS
jgi:hypothetical protein